MKYTEPDGLVNFEVEELTSEERERFIDEHGLPSSAVDENGSERPVRLIRFIVEDDGIGMSKEFMSARVRPVRARRRSDASVG